MTQRITHGNNKGAHVRRHLKKTSKKKQSRDTAAAAAVAITDPSIASSSTSASTFSGTTGNNFSVSETVLTMMRPRAVTFTVQGLKPNTRYYPFFDDVFVGDYCTTADTPTLTSDGKIQSVDQTIMTDTLGVVVGNFYIPAGTFSTGSHSFRLVDNIRVNGGAVSAEPLYGSAEASYEASGVLKQQQTQVTPDTSTTLDTVSQDAVTPVVVPLQVTKPPVVECETWYFQYQTAQTQVKYFTVTNHNPTPSTDPKPQAGSSIESGSVKFISTTSRPHNNSGHLIYDHKYQYVETSKNRGTMRQEWIGVGPISDPDTEIMDLTNFRPTGILDSTSVKITKGWTRVGKSACPVVYGLRTPTRSDPLAQSFFVDGNTYPAGMFVTAIGVYFRTVDQSTPVTLELRTMSNGLPGSDILPGGVALIPGYAASESIDASMSTVFRFDQPVFLSPSTDYCFVLKSTSLGYNVWCSRVGETDVNDGKIIDSQPFVGTLFKSENDVTWSPDQYEDVRFDLYKADFNNAVEGDLIFRPHQNTSNSQYFSTAQNLPLSFISTTKDSKVVKLRIPMHNLIDNDKILIEGIVAPSPADGYNNIRASQLNATHTVTVLNEDEVTITVTGAESANKTGSLQVQDKYSLLSNVPSLMPTLVPLTAAPAAIQEGINSPSTVQTAELVVQQPIPPVYVSNNTFTVYHNIQVNEVMIDYMGTEFPEAEVVEWVRLATGVSTAGAEIPYQAGEQVELQRGGEFHSYDEPHLIATALNEVENQSTLGGVTSAEINLLLRSGSKDVSPVVDVDGMSLTIRSYKIDNQGGEIGALVTENDFNDPTQNSEVLSGEGNAAAKYKSPINVLDTAYDSMSIFVTANCPAPAAMDVYIRTSTDSVTHIDRNWQWVPVNGVFGTAFVQSSDKYVTNEWFFQHNANEPFTVYDVKIVMRSTNNSVVPKIYGIRTIADNV
jgi:hypothetical protein